MVCMEVSLKQISCCDRMAAATAAASISSFGLRLDFVEQRFRSPELIEQGRILDAADARSRTGKRREQADFHRFPIGIERQRQRAFASIAARLRCGEQIDVADGGIVGIRQSGGW